MIRSFLAVELPESLRSALSTVQQELKQRLMREFSRDVRLTWAQPASIHLTVKFLGDIDEALVVPMRDAMRAALAGHQPVAVPLDRLGVFPRVQQPRVLWVGPSESWEQGREAERLASLHLAIEDCCDSLNLARDARPLSAHLTLARVKEGERSAGQALARSGVMDRPLTLGTLNVASVVLMKSDLKPTGAVYTRLWEVPLGHV